jgi:hypothetical protein
MPTILNQVKDLTREETGIYIYHSIRTTLSPSSFNITALGFCVADFHSTQRFLY